MSESYYLLIPTIPEYVPDATARERARERFSTFVPEAQNVATEVSDDTEFISAMGNFESASCPGCGATLDNDWWWRTLGAAYEESHFADLGITLPCCSAVASLNDLHYHFPQGFARFSLSAFEPNIFDLEDWQVRELEDLLGCTLRKIWVHV